MLTALVLATTIAAQPNDEQVELLKTFRNEFIHITPGKSNFPATFTMGRANGGGKNETPEHRVTFDGPFYIAKYEVPQNLWQAVMGRNPSRWKGPRNSVEMLSFDEAVDFCRRATGLMRAAKLIEADEEIRLPTEAEWEYVARAGTDTVYSFGNNPKDLDEYGWYTGNAAGNDPPVGAKKPNRWGLYDIHGYLWEWCLDPAHGDYKGAPNDGSAWTGKGDLSRRVVRGGSWKNPADQLTSSYRSLVSRALRDDAVGLRCVLTAVAEGSFSPSAQHEFVPADASLEVVWNKGEFTEGPALAPDGAILFSDIGNTIYCFDPNTGKTTVFRKESGRANGLMFDQQGRLVACEGANTGGGRRISITDRNGKVRTLSDNFDGKRFNSPNDLAIDPKGRVYFTDPRYVGDEPRQLDFEGVFLVDQDGKTTVATREAEKPNGILVSADGGHVYLADNNPSGARHLLLFDVKSDGTLANRRVLYDFGKGRGIDGMTLDTEGNVYATAGSGDMAGIYVFGPSGEQLAVIPTPGSPTNCVFGGGDQASTLYITAEGPIPEDPTKPRKYALYRIKLKKTGYHVVKLGSDR